MPNKDDYTTQLNKINGNSGSGLDFFWSDYGAVNYNNVIPDYEIINPLEVSWGPVYSNRSQPLVSSVFYASSMPYALLTVNIVTSGNNATLTIDGMQNVVGNCKYSAYGSYKFFTIAADGTDVSPEFYTNDTRVVNENTFWSYWAFPNHYVNTNTFDALMGWLADEFRNITLIVDGETWITGGIPPIVYNWQSVPSISGKNGISLLSIIKNSAINSGDAVSGASADAFDRLEETTKISTLIQGITEETPIIYSDDVNYMSITPTANNTCTLKFYLHGSVIYTLTDVSINAYLSFLIDETNGIMKPSIIYEDS